MTDFTQLDNAVSSAKRDLLQAHANLLAATGAAVPAAEDALKAAKEKLRLAQEAWDWAIGAPRKQGFYSWISSNSLVGVASFLILFILIIIAACLHEPVSKFLSNLADVDTARGVISGIVVGVTALLAIILIFSAISGSDNDNEKSFNRGKEIFVVLVGICGTCVGYYFSQGTNSGIKGLTVVGPQITYSEKLDSAKVEAFVSGGRGPWQYELTWDNKDMPKMPSATTVSGGVTVNVPLPEGWKDKITGKLLLKDSGGFNQGLDVILQRAPAEQGTPKGGENKPGAGGAGEKLTLKVETPQFSADKKTITIKGTVSGGTKKYTLKATAEGGVLKPEPAIVDDKGGFTAVLTSDKEFIAGKEVTIEVTDEKGPPATQKVKIP